VKSLIFILITCFYYTNSFALVPLLERDKSRFPGFIKYLNAIQFKPLKAIEKGNEKFSHAKLVYWGTRQDWDRFFQKAATENLTNLKAFALLSREVKKHKVTLYGPGKDFMDAVSGNNIDLGLSIPATNVAMAVWAPVNDPKQPGLVLHIKIIYWKPFKHRFRDEVLPATLKIGMGETVEFYLDGKRHKGQLIEADIYYGEFTGFRRIKGVGGLKHGILGFFQKLLFFLPDAVSAMVIRPDGVMVTEALMNTEVKNFENEAKYVIKFKNRM